jgi:hypothetical protein
MSCCPLEVTIAPKPDSHAAADLPTHDIVILPAFQILTLPWESSFVAVPVFHSGRDTLLQTRLLRI